MKNEIEIITEELELTKEEKEFILNNRKLLTEIYSLGYHQGRIECFNLAFGSKQRGIES